MPIDLRTEQQLIDGPARDRSWRRCFVARSGASDGGRRLTGFEWAVGVPGSIGGAVRMNAGGHGSDMANCLLDVDVFDFADPSDADPGDADPGDAVVTISLAELGLRFRASSLAPSRVVLRARLRLTVGDRTRAEAEIGDIVRWRREHQPGGQNCGSVFVNPVPGEVTAGGLIDSLGLRGFRIGSAWVSRNTPTSSRPPTAAERLTCGP